VPPGSLAAAVAALLALAGRAAAPGPTAEGPAPPEPAPKARSTAEDPAPPEPAPKARSTAGATTTPSTPEGPALPPEATGARTTSARSWLQGGEDAPATDPKRLAGLGLTRQRDGSALYVDPGKRFTAAFNPDGSVRFGDRWGRDQHGQRMKGSGWALRQIGPSGIGMSGPTEWLLDLSGVERDAAAKTALLNATRELRIGLAVAFTHNLLRTRLAELDGELRAISDDADQTLAERRALLFQRWDECDERMTRDLPSAAPEEALSEIDRARLDAAASARRTIETFIRRQYPKGSARAYTPAELAEFNRRRVSAEEFAPYRPRQEPAR
jgi:hypothetical protein